MLDKKMGNMNQKRYWLRGGIIGVTGISLISLGLAMLGLVVLVDNTFWTFAEYLGSPIISSLCSGWCIGTGIIVGSPIFIVETFIIGAILGWIYGKIKNRNHPKSNI